MIWSNSNNNTKLGLVFWSTIVELIPYILGNADAITC